MGLGVDNLKSSVECLHKPPLLVIWGNFVDQDSTSHNEQAIVNEPNVRLYIRCSIGISPGKNMPTGRRQSVRKGEPYRLQRIELNLAELDRFNSEPML